MLKKLLNAFLTFFFHHLYHRLAFTYDLVAAVVSLGRWRRWVQAAIPLIAGPRVLELSTGPGHLQADLLRMGIEAYGLDKSRQMTRMAFRRLSRLKLPHRLTRGDAQHLPFPPHFFDSVVATFPSPYIQQSNTLLEIRRVLKPGAKLVVLLSATFTGRSLPEQAARTLFKVTGEAPNLTPGGNPLLEPFLAAGFDAQVEWIGVSGNLILAILATT